MGIFEIKDAAKGAFAIAEAIAKNQEAISIIRGGDSLKGINKSGHGNDGDKSHHTPRRRGPLFASGVKSKQSTRASSSKHQ
jgi:hypothetical protein